MNTESGLLARYEGFGSVVCCPHGFVHVQLGLTTLTLTEAQYQRFVAMLTDSAANFELRGPSAVESATKHADCQGGDLSESDHRDLLPN